MVLTHDVLHLCLHGAKTVPLWAYACSSPQSDCRLEPMPSVPKSVCRLLHLPSHPATAPATASVKVFLGRQHKALPTRRANCHIHCHNAPMLAQKQLHFFFSFAHVQDMFLMECGNELLSK